MNALTLTVASIRSRPLHATLCTMAVAAGITLLCAVFLFSQAVSSGLTRNAQGIDIIVGSKGSPLQLVLSSVYHADIPAGNIDMHAYEDLKRNRHVRQAIPLALGDSYQGFRLVGTTADYLNLYNAEFAHGKVFSAPFEVVAGTDTGLKTGEKIAVTHGFSANSDDVHNDTLYTITGVLQPTGTVLDKLLITPYKSIQKLHAEHGNHEHHQGEEENKHDHEEHKNTKDLHVHKHEHEKSYHEEFDNHEEGPAHNENEAKQENQITSIILKVRSPIDMMNLPRTINNKEGIMAAVPSYEMARFAKNLGIGRQLIVVLAIGFIILSSLMLLASLASGLALRRYDLAVLRVLGARPHRLAATVIAESLIISGTGALIGIIVGHVLAYGAILSIDSLRGLVIPESVFLPQTMDGVFLLIGLFAGLIASFVPAITAARTDIADLLARGRA